jgi:hypothetical protein
MDDRTSTRTVPRLSCVATALALGIAALVSAEAPPAGRASGPLRVLESNPRYFTHDGSKAVLLVGSHTWNNLVDMTMADEDPVFDYEAYLAWLVERDHNCFRLWRWELFRWDTEANREGKPKVLRVDLHPWLRTGPGDAVDGKPKFDLARFDERYFERLRARVRAAQDKGLYPAVMLFEGWGLQFSTDAWLHHPFHPRNQTNGFDADLDRDGKGIEIFTGRSREATAIQEAYVRKTIDTLNEFDNVLYEISNENHPESTEWQYRMIRFIKEVEKGKPKQHPVGMTFQYKGGTNQALFDGPADWISPNLEGGYRDAPPPADGSKVILNDTDHLWGIGGNEAWVWKSFLAGENVLFMDPFDRSVLSGGKDLAWAEPVRKALGAVARTAAGIDLARMTPQPALATTRACLAAEGRAYLVWVPKGTSVTVDLERAAGDFTVAWIDPVSGVAKPATAKVQGGRKAEFGAPPGERDRVLHLKRVP